jgi:hypothetical protein
MKISTAIVQGAQTGLAILSDSCQAKALIERDLRQSDRIDISSY